MLLKQRSDFRKDQRVFGKAGEVDLKSLEVVSGEDDVGEEDEGDKILAWVGATAAPNHTISC